MDLPLKESYTLEESVEIARRVAEIAKYLFSYAIHKGDDLWNREPSRAETDSLENTLREYEEIPKQIRERFCMELEEIPNLKERLRRDREKFPKPNT